ncbi:DNA-directed RNA polymerase II subunit rpb1 [Rhizophlyctis rosea]|nr:DNA-directed RNA polymerase II subunit rpb1 [Rhizophlyctis rosea]
MNTPRKRLLKDSVQKGPEKSAHATIDAPDELPIEELLDTVKFLKSISDDILNNITIKGIPGIKKAFISERQRPIVAQDGSISSEREYVIETDGINMRAVMEHECVDPYQLVCNNPSDSYRTYGIGCGRGMLMTKIRAVIADGGSHINYRYHALLCDTMT